MYIYIYREREREGDKNLYKKVAIPCSKPGCLPQL